MKLRRPVRQAIEQASAVYATVEDYQLGLATVRLGVAGARLTNLSTIGGIVEPGQRVVVDYTAGLRPTVRPEYFTVEEEPELTEIETPSEKGQGIPDIGGYYCRTAYYDDPQAIVMVRGIPVVIPFGPENYDDWMFGCYWRSGGMWVPSGGFSERLQATVSGKYIIYAQVNDWIYEHWGIYTGFERMRILKQVAFTGEEEVVAEMNVRDVESPYNGNNPGLSLCAITQMDEGDYVCMELMYTYPQDFYEMDFYDWHYYDGHCMAIQFIPNSQRAPKNIKSYAQAYIYAVGQAVTYNPVYLACQFWRNKTSAFTYGGGAAITNKPCYMFGYIYVGDPKPAYTDGQLQTHWWRHAFTRGGIISSAPAFTTMGYYTSTPATIRATASVTSLGRTVQWGCPDDDAWHILMWSIKGQFAGTGEPSDEDDQAIVDGASYRGIEVRYTGYYEIILYLEGRYTEHCEIRVNDTAITDEEFIGTYGGDSWPEVRETVQWQWVGELTAGDVIEFYRKAVNSQSTLYARFESYTPRLIVRRID